jgi:GT2 family glycosyltransferase
MTVAAITITYNRLELTKKTVESFYSKTGVDYHLFIDNGSTDGTIDYLKDKFDHISLGSNYGITRAFVTAFEALDKRYDFVLKLDNDIETVTEDIINRMLDFYAVAGMNYVASPVDLLLDPNFAPHVIRKTKIGGYNVSITSHTGGAFQMIPYDICRDLCRDYKHFSKGDYMIGNFYQKHGHWPCYLLDLQMKHIGLNQSTNGEKYIL